MLLKDIILSFCIDIFFIHFLFAFLGLLNRHSSLSHLRLLYHHWNMLLLMSFVFVWSDLIVEEHMKAWVVRGLNGTRHSFHLSNMNAVIIRCVVPTMLVHDLFFMPKGHPLRHSS
ncbi:hypothetical protein AQUCO_01100495v1 [Aquilegia coerulea]|uniref:Uncharacterized protein n=1 Tax=Aquilegia coerulea TaxID=218851 RepID=A0A2G5E7C3_AQUCA|nr:hypothetical protein AQUCO_01100495v1 [Aquilegia coerulea]